MVMGFRKRFSFWFILAVCSSWFGLSCGSGSGEVVNNNLGGGFSLGEVVVLDLGSSNQATVTFGALSGGEVFVFGLSNADVNAGSLSWTLSGATSADTSLEQDMAFSLHEADAANSTLEDESPDLTPSFHETLRNREEIIAAVTESQGDASFAVGIDPTVTNCGGGPSIGSSISIKIFTSLSGSSTATRSLTVKKVTSNAIFAVDPLVTSSIISDAELDELFTAFDDKIASEKSVFGDWDHASECRFTVAMSPVVNCLGASGGGFVTGYFYGGDQYDDSQITASNERSIIYIASPNPSGDLYCSGISLSKSFYLSNIGPSVMPHEFQHLINFNQRVFFDGHSSEASWLNEAMSHFAEDMDMSGSSYSFASVSEENPSRVSLYLDSINSVAFTGGTSLTQRGGSYLFLRYLYEQANNGNISGVSTGDAVLSGLINGANTGTDNIADVTEESFQDLLRDFCSAVYLDGLGLSSDNTYNFSGIDLRGSQDDNRGTELSGPAVTSYSGSSTSGSVNSPSCLFIEMTGTQVSSAGSEVAISGPSGAAASGVVIRAN